MAGFLVLCAASVTAATVLVGMFAPPWASKDGQAWPVVALAALFILGSTRLCLRLEGRRAVSFRPRFTHLAIGLASGVALVGLLAWALMLAGVLHWQPNRGFSASLMLSGTAYFCCAVLVEELVFRGYALQRLAEGVGSRAAVALFAAAFGGYHLLTLGTSPSVKAGGADLLWVAAGPAIGAIVFGVAALRTGGIALPVGLHLGWNWTQWHFFTFAADDNPVGLWNPLVMPWHTEHPAAFRIGYATAMALALIIVVITTRRADARPLFPPVPPTVTLS